MLKQGFQDEMEYLLAFAPQNAQALLFCATMTPALHSIANDFCKPGMVSIDLVKDSASATAAADAEQRATTTAKGLAVAPTVTHEVLPVHPHARVGVIADILVTRAPRKAIVFVNTRHEAAAVARELWQIGLQSVATWDGCWPLHGDMPQEERSAALKEFRTEGRLKVCLCACPLRAVAILGQNWPKLGRFCRVSRQLDAKWPGSPSSICWLKLCVSVALCGCVYKSVY